MSLYRSFETERLHIKPTSEEDAPFLLKIMNSPKWLQNIGDRNVHSEEEAREYIRLKILPQLEKLGYSNYTIIRKKDNLKIGTCGLYDRVGLEGIDIGFAFLPEYEGKGYAYESCMELKRAAIEEFRIHSIKGITTKKNTASQNLLKKLGLKFKKIVALPGEKEELLLFETL